jgi:hypothetical protein
VNRASIIDLHTTAFKTCARNQMALPDALRILAAALDDVDGYPSQCIGASPSTSRGSDPDPEGNVKLTSVEAAAHRAASKQHTLTQISNVTRDIDRLESHLERLLTKVLPKIEPARCNGGLGRDGHITGWGQTDCKALVDHEGMCNDHIADERRWRVSVGKPERIIEHALTMAERNIRQGNGGRFERAS